MANTPKFHGTPIIEDKHGKILRPITRGQQELLEAMESNDIVFVNGPAGTGKSTIATWYGIAGIDSGLYNKLVLTRPIVEAGEELGFLPGTFEEKVAPYMQPLYEAIEKVKGKRVVNTENAQIGKVQQKPIITSKSKSKSKSHKNIKQYKFDETTSSNDDFYKKVDVCPLAYLRGSTKAKSFIILDECFTGNTSIGYHVHGDKSIKSIKQLYKEFNNGIDLYTKSFNVDTNEYQTKKILNVTKKKSSNLVNIKLENRKKPITCTASHPFAVMGVDGIEWKLAYQLTKSDNLVKYTNGHNNSISLNEFDYDIILGLLLGDGSLTRNKSKTPAYRVQWIHGIDQSEYNDFLINTLNGTHRKGLKSGYTNKPLVGGTTKSLKLSLDFIDSIYKNGKKTITETISKYFTNRSLAIWIMDDGYYNKKTDILYLNTQGFTYNENVILADMLYTLYSIKPSIDKSGDYYMLRFKVEDTQKIFELVSHVIHPSMEYKISNKYHNKFCANAYATNTCYNYTTINIEHIELLNSTEYVYNLEIEDNNNYLVNGILVHNCQNVTPTQLKLMLTRLGYGSKLILCGDATQSDLDHNSKSGFTDAQKLLKGIDGIAFVHLDVNDIVRHKLIRDIIIRYEQKNRKNDSEVYSNRFDNESDQENYRDMRNFDYEEDYDDDDEGSNVPDNGYYEESDEYEEEEEEEEEEELEQK